MSYCNTAEEGKNANQTADLIEDLFAGYNKALYPPGERPIIARIGYFIFSFSDISEKTMDFSLSYYMRMSWKDPRLCFSPEDYGNITYVTLNPEQMRDEIWRPDPFYRNERGKSISADFFYI